MELWTPNDLLSTMLLFIEAVRGFNTIYDLLHSKEQEADQPRSKNKVVITTKEKRIELYNLTPEEVEKTKEQ